MIIVAQSTYTNIDVGLHNGTQLIRTAAIEKKDACAQLVPTLDALLHTEGITLGDATQIIVNLGPAPFSSLRTVITTMNGISFAAGIPLVGVSVFDALNYEYNSENVRELLIVLRAYSKEYYYGFYAPGKEPVIGMCASDQLPPVALKKQTQIIGHQDALAPELQQNLKITPVSYASLEAVAQAGINKIKELAPASHHLSPLYIKNY
jgi:tRNA threonylcarbamoyl adenosine modification protein YeaZ